MGYKMGYKKNKVCNLGFERLKMVSGYKMILRLQNGLRFLYTFYLFVYQLLKWLRLTSYKVAKIFLQNH